MLAWRAAEPDANAGPIVADAVIAAAALTRAATLGTESQKHRERTPGLVLEDRLRA